MKTLLISPSKRIAYGDMDPPDYPPIGLAYIGAVLEKDGHQVHILDMDIEKMDINQLKGFLNEYCPEIVGISCATPLFKTSLLLAKTCKENKVPYVAIGGIHPTIKPREVISSEYVDFVIRGEGEITMSELLKKLEEKNKKLGDIDGLTFKEKGKIKNNKNRELINDLDSLPFPARHLFKHFKYTYPDAMYSPTIPIMTSRGCPGQCTYCQTKQICGLRYRFRSAKNILDEIEHLIEKYKAKEIHIWDDNFTVNKKRVLDFCKEFKERNIDIPISIPQGLRVDQVDEETLKALKEIGVYSLGFGVESGNNEILRIVKKNTNTDQIRKAISLAKKFKFEIWAFFMIGLPGDTEETIRQTIDFAKELDPDLAKFLILKPFPGSEVYKQLDEQGLILEKDYDKYGVYHTPVHKLPTVSPQRMLEIEKKAYREFYFRPKKILQQITRTKSVHRFRLNLKAALSILKLRI